MTPGDADAVAAGARLRIRCSDLRLGDLLGDPAGRGFGDWAEAPVADMLLDPVRRELAVALAAAPDAAPDAAPPAGLADALRRRFELPVRLTLRPAGADAGEGVHANGVPHVPGGEPPVRDGETDAVDGDAAPEGTAESSEHSAAASQHAATAEAEVVAEAASTDAASREAAASAAATEHAPAAAMSGGDVLPAWGVAVERLAGLMAAAGVLRDRPAEVGPDGALFVTLRNEAERELLERQGVRERLGQMLAAEGTVTDVVFRVAPPSPDGDAPAGPADPEEIVREAQALLRRRRERRKPEGERVWGRPFDGRPTPIRECVTAGSRVVVEGRVFHAETTALPGGRARLDLHVTDDDDSLVVKIFDDDPGELARLLEAVSGEGWLVRARGTLEQDARGEDVQLKAEGLRRLPRPVRREEGPGGRVELHVHTRLSAMDGLVDPDALFARAAAWGMAAVGIADHGVVQAFPEVAQAARRHGVKPLYGMEAYVVDDAPPVVVRPDGRDVKGGSFLALDLETTGLSPRGHEIIEIGAVRFREGEPVARFHSFVDPGRELPAATTELTGITTAMLEGAPAAAEALASFLEFAGDDLVVAHNAAFDLGFIHCRASALLGREFRPAAVDTMWLSRALLQDLAAHGLAQAAKALGVALGRHHRAADDAESAGRIFLKLLARSGAETLDDLRRIARAVPSRFGRPFHVLLFAVDGRGLKNLYRLVSESHLEHFHRVPRLPKGRLAELREGILVGAGGAESEVVSAWLAGEPEDEWRERIRFYDFLELVPRGRLAGLVPAYVSDEGLCDLQRAIFRAGSESGLPVVAAGDVHQLDPEESVFRRVLEANRHGGEEPPEDGHLRTTAEMLEEFAYLGEEEARRAVVDAPRELADRIQPVEPLPDGLFAPEIEGAAEEVAEIARRRAAQLYGDPLPDAVASRLDYELERIVGHGYAALYLIAARLVARSLADGYLVGSRGSVGSSLVATLLGITEVNPLPPHYVCTECGRGEFEGIPAEVRSGFDLPPRDCGACGRPLRGDGHDIPFASFMGFEGDKVPDIDLNFSGEYQARAHRAAEEILGEGNVFRAGTIATIAERTAFGLVRAYAERAGRTLRPAEVRRLALGCTGVKRTTGQHPGGLMVVPRGADVHDFTPLQRPANDGDASHVTTHFDYHSIEGRLVKLDLLGHDDPTTLKMLHEMTGLDPLSIPFGDPATRSIFSSAHALGLAGDREGEVGTLGIPEFGTRFVRGMLQDTRPRTFAELTRISGLSHGTDVWANNARDLTRSGTASLSEVISTRDDLYLYLIQAGMEPRRAFDIGERVRKGRGLTRDDEREMEELGVPAWFIESCRKITYLFPKAHAVAYVMMAFRIAWYKVHRPAAFYAAYFTIHAADFDALWATMGPAERIERARELERRGASAKDRAQAAVLEVAAEMAERGIEFLPVDLARSDAERFLVEPEEAAREERPTRAGLRVPFAAVPGLGEKAANAIVAARREGPFRSLADFRQRTSVSRAVIDVLERQGALDGLPEDDQIALF